MKSLKWWGIVIAAVLLLGSVAAMGAAPADNSGKGPIDKVVFAEYPKNNPRNPGAGWVSSGGVLSPDYQYSGLHWANPKAITYYVNPSKSGVGSNMTISAINAAFVTWDNASGPLGYLYGGSTDSTAGVQDGKNVVSWGDTRQYPNAIAVTIVWYKYNRFNREIVEVDTLMNSTLAWSHTPPTYPQGTPSTGPDLSGRATPVASRYVDPTDTGVSGTYDIQDIMTHEAGHWIMLGDLYSSRDRLLTMYGYGATGELTKDTLGYGDELGVERVYGP
jgi:hypothetical protein